MDYNCILVFFLNHIGIIIRRGNKARETTPKLITALITAPTWGDNYVFDRLDE